MDFVLTSVLCVIIAFLIFLVNRKPKDFPPGSYALNNFIMTVNYITTLKGPRRWPLIGSLLSMKPQPGDTSFDIFDRLRNKHGNFIGLYLGSQPTILVSGLENVKKICASDEFLFRPHLPVTQHAKFGSEKKLGKQT